MPAMTAIDRQGPKVSLAEFEAIFESVKTGGAGGRRRARHDELRHAREGARGGGAGAIRPARLDGDPDQHGGRPGQPEPGDPHRVQTHDVPVGSSKVRFAMDFLGMAPRRLPHPRRRALPHLVRRAAPTTDGRRVGACSRRDGAGHDDYQTGIVGRGVLLDIPRLRGVPWLEPGEAVTRAELEEAEAAQGVRLGEGDILVFRTGHHRRRLELGAWDNGPPPRARARPASTSTRSRGCTSSGSRRSCPTATVRPCRASSTACSTRSIRCRSSRWECWSPTASSSRSSPRPARRRGAASSWSWRCPCDCPAAPARPGTRSRYSDAAMS